MAPTGKPAKGGWRQKLAYETKQFLVVSLYLLFLFGTFNLYQRLITAEYHVKDYLAYGYALVEALILAKVVLVGESLGLGERFADRPLIVPTLYKTLLFSLFVLVFSILEHLLGGLVDGKSLAQISAELLHRSRYQILSRLLMMIAAFIPFFAFREAMRVLGEVKLFDLFFRRRGPAPLDRAGQEAPPRVD